MFTLKTPIEELSQIGPRYVLYLRKLGIKTAGDLLFHFPFRYDDFSDFKNIADVEVGQTVSIKGEILDIQNIRTRKRRMTLTEALVEDDSGAIKVVWFNQPFITNNLKKGVHVSLSGKVAYAKEGLQLTSPAYELLGRSGLHTGRLVPVYHETEGVSSKWLRVHIKPIISLSGSVEEFLPEEILERQDFFDISEAIKQIHFPDDEEAGRLAKRRLAFDELFLIQLFLQKQRQKWQRQEAIKIEFNTEREIEIKNFLKKLPFKLTDGQKIAVWKIIKDLERNVPMNRLLEGDVGSGKTLVALLACLVAIRSGYQALVMAPTEILARQHYAESLKRFGNDMTQILKQVQDDNSEGVGGVLDNNSPIESGLRGVLNSEIEQYNIKVALLTGSENKFFDGAKEKSVSKEKLLDMIKKGKVDLVIGTHALIQEKVSFKKLALSVVDEQHRFGIEQRSKLQKDIVSVEDGLPTVPHLLSMTATPIPRTLALTVYGDLDLSVLKEMPKGRQKIITKLVAPGNRESAYAFIQKQVESGRQVFVICPLIEESDVLEVKSATEEYERLRKEIYPNLSVGLLHGKLKSKEKEDVMKKFAERKIDILVSTSVVEVGVDIPNATVMMIEGADRFGLAQLHQFRGRVGRSEFQSYCFLFTDSTSGKAHRRLKALVENDSGFDLAEKDLALRGPGELVGIRQSGLPDLAMASLKDSELIITAKNEAEKILKKSSDLKKYPKLAKRVALFEKDVHLE